MTTERQLTQDVEYYSDTLAQSIAYVEFWYEQWIKAMGPADHRSETAPGSARQHGAPAAVAAADTRRHEAQELLSRGLAARERADHQLKQAGLPALALYVVPSEPEATYTEDPHAELLRAVKEVDGTAAKLKAALITWSEQQPRAGPSGEGARSAGGEPAAADAAESGKPPRTLGQRRYFLYGAFVLAVGFACLMTTLLGIALATLVFDLSL
jgi:hypothetical protein